MQALTLLRHCEKRALPRLYPHLNEARLKHIRAVNNAFTALVRGNFASLYNALQPRIKKNTDYHKYCLTLSKIREQYFSLSGKEKQNLAAAVALHDIGYLENQGLKHNKAGARLASYFMMVAGIAGVDRMAVSEIIQAHGLYSDATVQFLLADTKEYSETRQTQILILNILDCIGKPAGSSLSQQVLDILIGLKEGVYDDPQKYFELRLRTLLGPANYSWVDDDTHEVIFGSVRWLATKERTSLFRNVTSRFRNNCWPVFKGLVLDHEGAMNFFALLMLLSDAADRMFPGKKYIDLVFKPDLFEVQPEQHARYLIALRYRSVAGMTFEFINNGDSGTIIVDLEKFCG